jgi:2-dehydro-3-deoxyphosphogluconate aldolase/(4S)-4-hydroxy-2-oxoglutarate aldolase
MDRADPVHGRRRAAHLCSFERLTLIWATHIVRGVIASIEDLRAGPAAAAIRAQRLIAVLRRVEPRARLLALVGELLDDGVGVLEVTLDGATAAADLVAVITDVGNRAVVGAGTIRTDAGVRAAIRAGAAFGVAPAFDPAIVALALGAGLPFVPGAATPTEADLAWRAGATCVKVFPASSLEPSFVRELRGPMPEIETIATGGIDASTALPFLDAGAVAVGIGSALTRMGRPERRDLVALAAAR